jgi:hypothetical protein
VERLNVGTIISLPVGIAAYFWANRLIPVSFVDRAAWEANVMFIVWAALLHAALWPVARAWIEQFCLTAVVFALLPLNVLTTDRHLGVSLLEGDWVMAGFDLTMLAFGAAFATVAWMLILKRRAQGAGSRSSSRALVAIQYARATECSRCSHGDWPTPVLPSWRWIGITGRCGIAVSPAVCAYCCGWLAWAVLDRRS